MKETTNFKFALPEDVDTINVSDLTGNFERIDTYLGVLMVSNKLIIGTEDLKVYYEYVSSGADGAITFADTALTDNYYNASLNISFSLYLDGSKVLSEDGSWDLAIYPEGESGTVKASTGIQLAIHLCYNPFKKEFYFEASDDYITYDMSIVSEDSIIRIPIGMIDIDTDGDIVLNSVEMYDSNVESGVYFKGLMEV